MCTKWANAGPHPHWAEYLAAVVVVVDAAAAAAVVGLLALAKLECIVRHGFPDIVAEGLANVRHISVVLGCVGQSPVRMVALQRASHDGIRPRLVARPHPAVFGTRAASLGFHTNETVESPPMCAHFAIADSSSANRLCSRQALAAHALDIVVDTVPLAQYRAASTDRFGISVW